MAASRGKRARVLNAQDYVSQLIAENGKIEILQEYLNAIKTARALLPNGLADVPPAVD